MTEEREGGKGDKTLVALTTKLENQDSHLEVLEERNEILQIFQGWHSSPET